MTPIEVVRSKQSWAASPAVQSVNPRTKEDFVYPVRLTHSPLSVVVTVCERTSGRSTAADLIALIPSTFWA